MQSSLLRNYNILHYYEHNFVSNSALPFFVFFLLSFSFTYITSSSSRYNPIQNIFEDENKYTTY